jgi:hypothetical protein
MRRKVKMRGVIYSVEFVDRFRFRKDIGRKFRQVGDCDEPTSARPTIRVSNDLKQSETLEILIHEMLHACCFDLKEETVTQTARSIQRALYALGYRLVKQGKKKR